MTDFDIPDNRLHAALSIGVLQVLPPEQMGLIFGAAIQLLLGAGASPDAIRVALHKLARDAQMPIWTIEVALENYWLALEDFARQTPQH